MPHPLHNASQFGLVRHPAWTAWRLRGNGTWEACGSADTKQAAAELLRDGRAAGLTSKVLPRGQEP